MIRILSALLLLAAFVPACGAQIVLYDERPRLLLGVTGGSAYGSDYIALDTGFEFPFAKRFELGGGSTFAPLEHKGILGFGTSQKYKVGGIIWIRRNIGINASFERASYRVTMASKAAEYTFTGLTYRTVADGFPMRLSVNYVRQVNNRIACNTWSAVGTCLNGTEANYLRGGDFNVVFRVGTLGPTVVRMVIDVQLGRVLHQGNPQCDGTFGGPITCPRAVGIGGGSSFGVVFELHRHRGYEDSAF